MGLSVLTDSFFVLQENSKGDEVTEEKGRYVKVGKLKSVTSKRNVPMNDAAI